MNTSLNELQDLRGKSGIYFLYKEDEIVYIGQSGNIYTRLLEHSHEGIKDFDKYKIIETEKDNIFQREIYELAFISVKKPKYNKLIIEDVTQWIYALPTSFKDKVYEMSFYSEKKNSLHTLGLLEFVDFNSFEVISHMNDLIQVLKDRK